MGQGWEWRRQDLVGEESHKVYSSQGKPLGCHHQDGKARWVGLQGRGGDVCVWEGGVVHEQNFGLEPLEILGEMVGKFL